MRRLLSLVTVAVIMAAMMVAMAMPAFAVASSQANCMGQGQSESATSNGVEFGQGTAETAQGGGVGDFISPESPECSPGR